MGSQTSTNNERTHGSVNNNIITDLYQACSQGNYEFVLQLLESSSFEAINRLEANGSTALHVAVEKGYTNIVALLLDTYGIMRHLTNRDGRTAFELARTNEMRRLFQRPSSSGNRFYGDDSFVAMFTAVLKNKKQNYNQQTSSERVQRYETLEDLRHHQIYEVQGQYWKEVINGFKSFTFQQPEESIRQQQASELQSLVDQYIRSSHQQYAKANELANSFRTKGEVESLIRLYTLETPFYRYINSGKESSAKLALPLMRSMASVRDRAFTGICYRGLSMTKQDLKAYERAKQNKDQCLETNTFCSTTTDIAQAIFYAEANENGQRQKALMVFEFPTSCETAIRLEKISDELPCLSDFEDEKEILVMPGVLFSVTEIQETKSLTTIHLTHLYNEHDVQVYWELYDDILNTLEY
ncbi:unnamed protein product [Rotaria sp. Silwood2]|nr:unnamed protein product [Rotaria sp. Silwood2]CAF4546185.1 unnamed protein product [Rotaria sp. Silwood2]